MINSSMWFRVKSTPVTELYSGKKIKNNLKKKTFRKAINWHLTLCTLWNTNFQVKSTTCKSLIKYTLLNYNHIDMCISQNPCWRKPAGNWFFLVLSGCSVRYFGHFGHSQDMTFRGLLFKVWHILPLWQIISYFICECQLMIAWLLLN